MGIRITADHKYFNDSGVQYQGVTSLIGMYKQPKDWLKIAAGYARKNGQTAEYWLNKWDKNKNEACDRGHEFHAYKEEQILNRGVERRWGVDRIVRNQALYAHKRSLYDLPDGIYPELMVWDDGYKLAGTGDEVNLETIHGVRYVDIDDHKTNGKIDEKSYQDRFTKRYEMMQYPVGHLMDCNLKHYELQLSFYMFALERHGFTPRRMRLTHYPPPMFGVEFETDVTERDGNGIIYPLEYRKREVLAILNHFSSKQRIHARPISA